MNSRELLAHYRAGDDAAAAALFERYAARLTALARGRIGRKLQRRIDPEDVVQSAYRSFFLHAQAGDYEVAETGDLWRLLAAITLHKLHRQVERHTAAKRSLTREEAAEPLAADRSAPEPSPAEVVALCEGLERTLGTLADDELLALANLLAGRSIEELAAVLGKTERTARRAVARLREQLERRLLSDEPRTMQRCSPPVEVHASLLYADYLLEQLLGSGGMGKVFRARERATGRAVAIKALHKARQQDPRAVSLFVQEAQILARLDHAGIVRVHGLGRFPGGGCFLAMDLVEGADLQNRLQRGALPPGEALRIALAIGEAVAHAHARGVVHCDLKPANVLLDGAGRVFVSDFGFAHLTAQAATARLLLGCTLGYVAPELLRGEAPTPAADIYSLGALLAALLRGPAADGPAPLGGLPDSAAPICRRCLADNRRERHPSMEAIAATGSSSAVFSLRQFMTTLSIICAWAVIAADPSAIAPPTYRLEVGQRIEAAVVCQGLSSPEATEAPDPEARVVYRWTFWVIDQNDKHGWRIIVRHGEVSPASGVTGVEMASFWLTPTGIVTWDQSRSEWPAHLGPEELWPRLPDAKDLLAGSWEQEDACNAVRWNYSAPALDGALVRFRGARQSPLQSVAGGQSAFVFDFDPREGRLTSVQSDERYLSYKEFYANQGNLERGSPLSPEELRQFREDWDRSLSALKTYRRAYGGAGIRATRLDGAPTLPAAIEKLRVTVDEIKSPEIREWAERRLARATRSAEQEAQSLAERAARLDQPAPDWSAKDLAGKEHSLSQYRGQVVLLDFWFRQCSYCIRLAPQLHRVEQTFQGKPFVLLSMNTDENEEDARIGAERLGLTGPVLLHADEIATGLGVAGFPTLVLIDAEGKVRDLFVGYSPSREADLQAAISRLLPP